MRQPADLAERRSERGIRKGIKSRRARARARGNSISGNSMMNRERAPELPPSQERGFLLI